MAKRPNPNTDPTDLADLANPFDGPAFKRSKQRGSLGGDYQKCLAGLEGKLYDYAVRGKMLKGEPKSFRSFFQIVSSASLIFFSFDTLFKFVPRAVSDYPHRITGKKMDWNAEQSTKRLADVIEKIYCCDDPAERQAVSLEREKVVNSLFDVIYGAAAYCPDAELSVVAYELFNM